MLVMMMVKIGAMVTIRAVGGVVRARVKLMAIIRLGVNHRTYDMLEDRVLPGGRSQWFLDAMVHVHNRLLCIQWFVMYTFAHMTG